MFELWNAGKRRGGMDRAGRTHVGLVCAIATLAMLAMPGCIQSDAADALALAPNAVLEIAVVRVDPARRAELPAIQAAVRREISAWPGFVAWRSFVSTSEPDLIADVLIWESARDAEATAELARKSAACQAYFALMRKEVLFHHFKELL